MANAPARLTIRAYQVGFGDCFLLTWHYAKRKRHVLIDFGSNAAPKTLADGLMERVALDIKAQTNGHLDAVVLTHRHKDHIWGFTTNKAGTGTGDIIRSLKPDLVVQPWTEDPAAAVDAKEATANLVKGRKDLVTPAAARVSSLESMELVSKGVVSEARQLQSSEPVNFRKQFFANLAFAGEEGIKNKLAVDNLRTMGKNRYVSHNSNSGLGSVLPGVRVTVLGPPTLRQSDSIRKERSVDQAEFWMFKGFAGRKMSTGGNRLFPRAETHKGKVLPEYARWFAPKLRLIRAHALQSIVRILDDAMNNTSVILLFEVGGKAFLFPGDAQIENWEYTLKQPALMKRLARVDFYKVGHHGSRNATPKSLWANFAKRGSSTKKPRLRTVVSTMAEKYGKTEGAEVPRKSLIAALKKDTDFYTTQSLKSRTRLSELFEYDL